MTNATSVSGLIVEESGPPGGRGRGRAARASTHSSEVPKPQVLALSLTPSFPPTLHAIHQQILGAPPSKDILNLTIPSTSVATPAQVSSLYAWTGAVVVSLLVLFLHLQPHLHASQNNPCKMSDGRRDAFCGLAHGIGPMSISGAGDYIYKRCHTHTPVSL